LHVAVVIGTRPEAIKLAPVVRELRRRSARVTVVSTGQHRHMLDQMLDQFEIVPDLELATMRPQQRLSDLTAALAGRLGRGLRKLRPDYVLVQGDTTSAMCGALCAFYEGIPVGHVEAGLRSGSVNSPFPEEANRKLVAVVSAHHFCPTPRSAEALLAEGVPADHIFVTGNTVVDMLHWAIGHHGLHARVPPPRRSRRILLTLHRRENHGAPMQSVCGAIRQIVEHRDVEVLFPVHKAPAVREVVMPMLGATAGVTLCEPMDYLCLAGTLASSDLVLTDSGGLQEEAPALGKPVLVLRDTTERLEAVEAGVARVIGTLASDVYAETLRLLDDEVAYASMAKGLSPFGDGRASERIVHEVLAAERAGVAAT
jgi:UDP-N-acetylglucosamine 2-epimerase (non-hydrolysing)